MTATVTVTGNVGQDPQVRYTQSGKAVCTLSVCATPRRQNRQTQEWDDDGEPVWLKIDFWDGDAETVADTVKRGNRVSLAGTLAVDAWTGQDGQRHESLVLRHPRFLGIVPKPRNTRESTQKPASKAHKPEPYPCSTQPENTAQNGTQQLPGSWEPPARQPYDQKAPF
jgi:single-strand DNA-binding protein